MTTTNMITYSDLVIDAEVVKHVVISGVSVAEGQLLGRITADGKYKDCQSDDADDGSRTVRCIALEAADATLADVEIPALFAGKVNESALVFAGTDDLATHFGNLCNTGIYPMSTMDP